MTGGHCADYASRDCGSIFWRVLRTLWADPMPLAVNVEDGYERQPYAVGASSYAEISRMLFGVPNDEKEE